MPRQGELTYYDAIGEAGRRHALSKPFSDENRGLLLMQVGAVFRLLPPPPARVLECGCGAGWLSMLLNRSGYQVVGVDVSPGAIELCRTNAVFGEKEPPTFLVADAERLPFADEFDAVVFFDSLHHAVDEQAAVAGAYRALKPGGVLIASETPPGHAENARELADRYDVTEKDMPPRKILRLGKTAGFRRRKVYPRADEIGRRLFGKPGERRGWKSKVFGAGPFKYLATLALMTVRRRSFGIAVMYK